MVRGADLLTSTCRQLLLYRALGLPEPAFFHTPLVLDAQGVRLAKRHDALSLRAMREQRATPEGLREGWVQPEVWVKPKGCASVQPEGWVKPELRTGTEAVALVASVAGEEEERQRQRRRVEEQTPKD